MTESTDAIRDFILHKLATDMNMTVDPASISVDSPIGPGGLDLESLGLIELTLHLEQQYGVKIADEDLEGLGSGTIGELVAYIEQRRQVS